MTTAKKTVAKKVAPAPKKSAGKAAPKKNLKNAKRVLVCANGEQCFWTTDGKIIGNLVELQKTLAAMAEDVFKHHVTRQKNDFADWVEFVLGDAELAGQLRRTAKPQTAQTVVVRRLKIYDI